MNRIDATFAKCKEENRKALVMYTTAGDPDIATSAKVLDTIATNGADVIEVGVPFSEPMADGPTIQLAMERALNSGTKLDLIIEMITEFRKSHETPIVLFSYYNVIMNYGVEKLAEKSAEVGIDGWLIVDVPYEEYDEVKPSLSKNGVQLITLLAPTTPEDRAKMILEEAEGFVYYITVTGVTGARTELPADLAENLAMITKHSPAPVVAGFGVSSGEMASVVSKHADGVVVGSALINKMANADSVEQGLADSKALVQELAAALK